jgi:hypothetical protein
MKPIQVAVLAAWLTGCAGSQAPSNLYEARDAMNRVGDTIEEGARPALEPLSTGVDRSMDKAIGSLGLRGRPTGQVSTK